MRILHFFITLLFLLLLTAMGWWLYQTFYKPTLLPPIQPPVTDNASQKDIPVSGQDAAISLGPPPVLTPKEPAETPEKDWFEWLAPPPPPIPAPPPPPPPSHVASLMESVVQQVKVTNAYDPSYVKIKYPMGDVDETTGVCTDVVVRAFRTQGVDLQKLVHKDMKRHFRKYPKKWGHKRPDTNIDHRRVPNLMTYFERQGKSLPISDNPRDYQAGDLVVWDLGTGQYHIGLVLHWYNDEGTRPLIGHNIAYGTNIEDFLFELPIVGHYRYFEREPSALAASFTKTP